VDVLVLCHLICILGNFTKFMQIILCICINISILFSGSLSPARVIQYVQYLNSHTGIPCFMALLL
jgi:type IV secretory pathway VirB2 component (pilin)